MSDASGDPLGDVAIEEIEPGAVDDAELEAALASSDPVVKQRGTRLCIHRSKADVDLLDPVFDRLVALLEDDSTVVVQNSAVALEPVSRVDPDRFEGAMDELETAVGSDVNSVRVSVTKVLSNVVVERPDLVAPLVGTLLTEMRIDKSPSEPDDLPIDDPAGLRQLRQHTSTYDREQYAVRESLVHVVVAVGEDHPEALFDHVDDLVETVEETDDDHRVLGGAIDALALVAEADPDRVEPAVDVLIDQLDSVDEGIRARAIKALGFAEATAALPELRSVAEDDDNEDVRALAAETVQFLEG